MCFFFFCLLQPKNGESAGEDDSMKMIVSEFGSVRRKAEEYEKKGEAHCKGTKKRERGGGRSATKHKNTAGKT